MPVYADPMPSPDSPEWMDWQRRHVMRGLADMSTDPELGRLAGAILTALVADEGDERDAAIERMGRQAEAVLERLDA